MKRVIFIILLLLLLRTPHASTTSALGQNAGLQERLDSVVSEKSAPFPDSEDDIFSSTYERELLSRKIFKKSLPVLSRKEKIIWSFKTAKANIFL